MQLSHLDSVVLILGGNDQSTTNLDAKVLIVYGAEYVTQEFDDSLPYAQPRVGHSQCNVVIVLERKL